MNKNWGERQGFQVKNPKQRQLNYLSSFVVATACPATSADAYGYSQIFRGECVGGGGGKETSRSHKSMSIPVAPSAKINFLMSCSRTKQQPLF